MKHGRAPEMIQASSGEEFISRLTEVAPKGTVFHPRPREVAFEPARILEAKGFSYFPLPIYETESGLWREDGSDLDLESFRTALRCARVVAFCSPSAIAGFVAGVGRFPQNLRLELRPLIAACIGQTTLAALPPLFGRVETAPLATTTSLVATCASLLENGS